MASSSSKLSRMASDCSHGGSNYKLSDFPIDIIFNILSGLPADTLVRLRIVCKLWNKVITDPAFIDLHLSKWIHIQPSCLILAPRTKDGNITRGLFLVDGIKENGWRFRQIQVENLQGNGFKVVGSCNGLICMAPVDVKKLDPIFVCNPVTGESICLPKSNISPDIFIKRLNPGFGFDPATKKYKVVRFLLLESFFGHQRYLGEVITVGESSWRKLSIRGSLERYLWMVFAYDLPMLFLNGSLFWVFCNYQNHIPSRIEFIRSQNPIPSRVKFILTFDIGSERFSKLIKLPSVKRGFGSNFINFEGSLAIAIFHFPNDVCVKISKIWRLVGSTATGFAFEEISCNVSYCRGIGILSAFFSDGTLLIESLEQNFCLATYHPTMKKYLTVEVFGVALLPLSVMFMPSFVSPKDVY